MARVSAIPVWVRTLLFLVVVSLAVAGSLALLWRAPLESVDPASLPAPDPEIVATARQVDAEFTAAWSAAGQTPAPLTDDLTVLRRLSLALFGTIPSFEEIRLAHQVPADRRIDWWLERAFRDPRYGDYVAERFARVCAGTESGPFLVFRRRRFVDWWSEQLQANRPYDDLVRQLIASTGSWTTAPETNFVTRDIVPKKGPDEARLAARVSRAFLGIRLDCVECHDDFLEGEWKQTDFHQLASFFRETDLAVTGVSDTAKDDYQVRLRGALAETQLAAAVPFGEHWLPAEGKLRTRLASWVTHPENAAFSRTAVNRIWALLFGQPLVAPVDRIPLEGDLPPGLDLLARDFVAQGCDLQRLIRVIAQTEVFRRSSIPTDAAAAWASFPMTRLRPEQVARSIYQAASLATVDASSHILLRIQRFGETRDFVTRYGDQGAEEFEPVTATVPQRLLLMNGKLVREHAKENLIMNAATRIGALARDDAAAVEAAFLAVLTRAPSSQEAEHFTGLLRGTKRSERARRMEDLYWSLFNSTEFSWNH